LRGRNEKKTFVKKRNHCSANREKRHESFATTCEEMESPGQRPGAKREDFECT